MGMGSPCSCNGETPRYSIETVAATKGLLVVSDGGAINDYGSFGWVLGTDQEVVWECKGIARGYPMHS
jgi:hypothetical protein